MKHSTREEWLNDLAKRLNAAIFDKAMPKHYRVTCGWPSRGATSVKNKTLGQCFDSALSNDKAHELIVTMALDDPMRVADILAHEMVHAIVGTEHGHKKPFRDLALKIGLTGKMTATIAGDAFKHSVKPILKLIGKYPHAKLDYTTQKKQSTRLIKCECELCGYTVRTTRKWIEFGAPICPIDNQQMEIT